MHRTTLGLLVAAAMTSACSSGGDSDSVLPGVEALVFSSRPADGDAFAERQMMDYLTYLGDREDIANGVRGGVFVLSPPTPSGTLRDLTAGFDKVDVQGIDLSFDATQVAFSMRHAGDDRYHVYLANVDGSGDIRQLTFGPSDDVRPIFVPGDRIALLTNQDYGPMGTRADEYNHSRVVSQIATISIATGDADRRLCSQNLSHTADPFLLSDGRIAYSRWEHLGPVNDMKLFAMRPDCSQMTALAGQHGKPFNSIAQVAELGEHEYIGVAAPREGTIQAGALIRVSIPSGEQSARFDNLTPAVPTDMSSPASGVGRYRYPRSLPNSDSLLVSWANGDVNERTEIAQTTPNFGIYMWDPETRERTLVYDNPNTWDQYAIPVVARDAPPTFDEVIPANVDPYTPAIIGSIDIRQTSLTETVTGASLDGMTLEEALGHATRVRIVEGFSSEIGAVGQFGLTMHEGAAVIGEAPVFGDGSWQAAVPPMVPYHLQPIDEFGMAIRNQLTWIQAMPGENRRCGGCHEDRAGNNGLIAGSAMTDASQAFEDPENDLDFTRTPITERYELPWAGTPDDGPNVAGRPYANVQALFDAKCVSCHSGGENDPFAGRGYGVQVETMEGEMLSYTIPYLDLSDRGIETYYENETVTYPASYVSLMYPSAMMGDSMAMGDVPPEWVTPGAARTSRLIEKLNPASEENPDVHAWTSMPHPADQGVTLTREEVQMLVRMADLGGQFWARQNVQGAAGWGTGTDYEEE